MEGPTGLLPSLGHLRRKSHRGHQPQRHIRIVFQASHHSPNPIADGDSERLDTETILRSFSRPAPPEHSEKQRTTDSQTRSAKTHHPYCAGFSIPSVGTTTKRSGNLPFDRLRSRWTSSSAQGTTYPSQPRVGNRRYAEFAMNSKGCRKGEKGTASDCWPEKEICPTAHWDNKLWGKSWNPVCRVKPAQTGATAHIAGITTNTTFGSVIASTLVRGPQVKKPTIGCILL